MKTVTENARTQRTSFIISTLGLAAVVLLGVWFFSEHREDFKRILEVDLYSFSIISVLCVIAIALSGLKLNAVMCIFRTRISLWEGFGLSALNTMANFYFTKAGIAAKGVYLKKQHQFPYAHFLSSTAGAYVVTLLSQGMLGLGFTLISAGNGRVSPELVIAFAALTACGFALFLVPTPRLRKSRWLPERISRVIEGWELVKRHRRILLLLAFLDIWCIFIQALRLYFSYHTLGYDVRLLHCFVIAPLSTLAAITSLTPGAVGIRQAVVGYSSELLDIGLAEGVMASTIDHAIGTVWVFCFGLLFSGWVWRRFGRVPTAKFEESDQ